MRGTHILDHRRPPRPRRQQLQGSSKQRGALASLPCRDLGIEEHWYRQPATETETETETAWTVQGGEGGREGEKEREIRYLAGSGLLTLSSELVNHLGDDSLESQVASRHDDLLSCLISVGSCIFISTPRPMSRPCRVSRCLVWLGFGLDRRCCCLMLSDAVRGHLRTLGQTAVVSKGGCAIAIERASGREGQ